MPMFISFISVVNIRAKITIYIARRREEMPLNSIVHVKINQGYQAHGAIGLCKETGANRLHQICSRSIETEAEARKNLLCMPYGG